MKQASTTRITIIRSKATSPKSRAWPWGGSMYTVQVAVGDAPYGALLSDLLRHTESCSVAAVDKPDPRQPGVMVVNEKTLDSLPSPIERPERVVLITPNEARRLERAW